MPQWEYAVLGPVKENFESPAPELMLLKPDGFERTALTDRWKGGTTMLGTTIARLGLEGWELVGAGPVKDVHYLYFRRPVSA
jgi:hypothetical protein